MSTLKFKLSNTYTFFPALIHLTGLVILPLSDSYLGMDLSSFPVTYLLVQCFLWILLLEVQDPFT